VVDYDKLQNTVCTMELRAKHGQRIRLALYGFHTIDSDLDTNNYLPKPCLKITLDVSTHSLCGLSNFKDNSDDWLSTSHVMTIQWSHDYDDELEEQQQYNIRLL
ncbi:unnamed protein product, partial [Didymodactylos carnosus]